MGTCHATGGHRSLLMSMVWVWVQIRRKMLGSSNQIRIELLGSTDPADCSMHIEMMILTNGVGFY